MLAACKVMLTSSGSNTAFYNIKKPGSEDSVFGSVSLLILRVRGGGALTSHDAVTSPVSSVPLAPVYHPSAGYPADYSIQGYLRRLR